MSGQGLMTFVIVIVGLCVIGALIFTAIDFVSADERFKKIAKLAVGGVLLIVFLVAVKNVLFGGGGEGAITPEALINFAIGVIVLLVVWFIIVKVLDWVAGQFPPIAPFKDIIVFVISAIVLIVLLILAADAFFGGGGIGGFQPFRRSMLTPDWTPAAIMRTIPQSSYPSGAA
jgi:hypothetical protein